eukprot:693725-Amphidinium_carterae.1
MKQMKHDFDDHSVALRSINLHCRTLIRLIQCAFAMTVLTCLPELELLWLTQSAFMRHAQKSELTNNKSFLQTYFSHNLKLFTDHKGIQFQGEFVRNLLKYSSYSSSTSWKTSSPRLPPTTPRPLWKFNNMIYPISSSSCLQHPLQELPIRTIISKLLTVQARLTQHSGGREKPWNGLT